VASREVPNATAKNLHEIVGTWSPELASAGRYEIWVHIPSHGAAFHQAEYVIFGDSSDASSSCVVHQDTAAMDSWVSMGSYALTRASRVELNNLADGADGSTDIAYDAMAFVPTADTVGPRCG
jgi:hypothetical protein